MKIKTIKLKKEVILISVFHTFLTLYSDLKFFNASTIMEHLSTIIFLKIILFLLLLVIWNTWFEFMNKNEKIINIFGYSLPYGAFLLVYMFLRHSMQLVNDELNIYNQVINYNIHPYHFTYITGIVYALSYLLIPCQMGVVIVKIMFQSLICGYCVYRVVDYAGKKGMMIYFLFLLYPTMTFGIQVHRMQFYSMIFLLLMVKLLLDNKKYNGGLTMQLKRVLFFMMILFSILSIWRKEGVYLVIMAPILLCIAYGIHSRKDIRWICISFLLIFAVIYFPEKIGKNRFTQESGHTYNSWFVNMCREGLDKNKYPDEMKMIDKYLSLEAVDYINEQLGDENYADEYIAWKKGYVGIRSNVSREDYENYTKAVRRIVLKEPWIFIKTRIGLWKYMSPHYGIIKNIMSDLNIPLLAVIVAAIYGLAKKNWLLFLMSGMTLAHGLVTLIFAPAAYTKYYFQLYLFGWFLLIWAVIYLSDILMQRVRLFNKDKSLERDRKSVV